MSRDKEKVEAAGDGGDPNAWMVTFSDLLTLMLTFFVLLISMSSLDAKALRESMSFFPGAFGVLQKGDAGPLDRSVVDSIMIQSRFNSLIEEMTNPEETDDIIRWAGRIVVPDWAELTADDRGALVRVSTSSCFEAGQTILKPKMRETLSDLAEIIADTDLDVLVEGHTDNLPVGSRKYPSNWELSTARAVEVVELMISRGVDPRRLAASGYAYTRPVAPNDSPANRAKNRRIEIVLLKENKEID